jgi:cell division protein ZapA (FtsZ GTPase activity inhibitor)
MGEFSISITVADRPYKLVIEKEYEELFRRAAKLIDSRIKTYSNNYAYKDKQDLLAMVALDTTINLLQHERNINEKETTLEKKLIELDIALTEVLTEQSV